MTSILHRSRLQSYCLSPDTLEDDIALIAYASFSSGTGVGVETSGACTGSCIGSSLPLTEPKLGKVRLQALASPLTRRQGRSISKFEEMNGYPSVNYREYAARRLMSLESGAQTLRGKEKNKILGPAPIGIPPVVLRASCLFLLENTA